MVKYIFFVAIMITLLFVVLVGGVFVAQSGPLTQVNPTEEQQTVDAIINFYLRQTATALSYTRTPIPSWTPMPTATLDAAAFDMSTATVYKAPNRVIEIPIPRGWQSEPGTDPGTYRFIYGDASTGVGAFAVLSIIIGEPNATYESVLDVTAADSPKAALEAFKKAQTASAPSGATQFSDVRETKIGKLNGSGLSFSIPGSQQTGSPDREIDLLIAPLPDGKIVMVIVQASKSIWDRAKPVMDKMIEGLVINALAIPTATPTETPHPLRLTQTAIQKQIEALTPTGVATSSK